MSKSIRLTFFLFVQTVNFDGLEHCVDIMSFGQMFFCSKDLESQDFEHLLKGKWKISKNIYFATPETCLQKFVL